MKYYCDKDLNITADLKYQITHDEMRYRVSALLDHRIQDGSYEFLTKWEGFDIEDATWEPVNVLVEDVPLICQQYVMDIAESDKLKSVLRRLVNL
jgi:hypothetical protein